MSESTADRLGALASTLAEPDATPNTTDPIVEEDESQEEELDTTEESTEEEAPETEEQEEEELPDSVKDILKKNRKELREAKARAIAAEKKLEAKESGAEEATESDSKFKELYLKSAAKQALVDAGITTGTDRFLKMLDLSSVEVDESGAVSGLEDQIADLKEDFKDVLSPKPVRKSTGNVDGSRRVAPTVPKSSADKLAGLLG